MTNQIDEQPVACHLFENTTQMSINPQLEFRGLEKGIMPCQIMYAPASTADQSVRDYSLTSECSGPSSFALKEKKCVFGGPSSFVATEL